MGKTAIFSGRLRPRFEEIQHVRIRPDGGLSRALYCYREFCIGHICA